MRVAATSVVSPRFVVVSYATTGSNNIGIGHDAGYNLTSGSNDIDIGNEGVAAESGIIRIGTAGTQTATYIAGGARYSGCAAPRFQRPRREDPAEERDDFTLAHGDGDVLQDGVMVGTIGKHEALRDVGSCNEICHASLYFASATA